MAFVLVAGCMAAPKTPDVALEPAAPSALTPASATPVVPVPPEPSLESRLAASKGWSWLVDKLVADGIPTARAEAAFADSRVPSFEGLLFAVEPHERRSLYRQVLRKHSVAQARACAIEYAPAFQAAERTTGVPAEVVAAILHVETRCGRNTGDSLVLYGLARLAMANAPLNVAANLSRHSGPDGAIDPALAERVRERARVLEETFYPEVRALFTVADAEGVDPLAIVGSGSGAFGAPQFLPTSYLSYGTDGNGDGRIDLYDVEDAAASTARYLASHGWQGKPTGAAQRRVIWAYNRSDAYIDAVLGLAKELKGSMRAYYAQSPTPAAATGAAQ